MKKKVQIYTDGACSGNPGPGGWAAILIYGEHSKELSGYEPETTNNRMEMTAVINGFQALKEPCQVTLFSDSQLVVQAFNSGWISNWLKTGFKGGKVKNIDLWQEILRVIAPHQVQWVWVKGHQDNPLNNRCDELARKAIADNNN
ncbi:MAG: ribonuclease HI [Bacillota bacterium]|jgi:ribonuclease HI|nr:ribonuclease HI [Bacillota bacterium]HOC06300.1 ribonuclease HI [Bacillota bacterium]HPZ22022.1 ribonuclease HI [Bacillota bacterium]HQD19762.1 ribonuclease HI [Bacillota bacterium]